MNGFTSGQDRFSLDSPTRVPLADAFLWNPRMILQMTCRGFASCQYLLQDTATYTRSPVLEAKTFRQPEQETYTHHPGRFFYCKDEETGALFSAPHEPVRAEPDHFLFSPGLSDIRWETEKSGIRIELSVFLPVHDSAELWEVRVFNRSNRKRSVSLYPYIPFGYMSWMNQGAAYSEEAGGIIASSVSPYQLLEDWPRIRALKDCVAFLHDRTPDSFETRRAFFEGEGGLSCPDSIREELLAKGTARYEQPAAILQYRMNLDPDESDVFRFLLAPVRDSGEALELRERYLSPDRFRSAREEAEAFATHCVPALHCETPDTHFNAFVNTWLPRQIRYHGLTNRLTSDPQTRNFLQDAMGMTWLDPAAAKESFRYALSRQNPEGSMPDGILLGDATEHAYINRVPHADHSLWLPVCLSAWLDETGDYTFLDEMIPGRDDKRTQTVHTRITRALTSLYSRRDRRDLLFIEQGDWCDPMNMVGPRGIGVSGWLTEAAAWAFSLWADITRSAGKARIANRFQKMSNRLAQAVNTVLWDGDWYARGITDEGTVFGTSGDREGRMFLNTQSWALLAGIADAKQKKAILNAVAANLDTPWGTQLFAPAYTSFREDVGRVSQKYPGAAENGSVYNHASIFWVYALFREGHTDRAWKTLRAMIPGPSHEDLEKRGQLPVYIPNYYRGAWRQFPEVSGKSSRLFNTGTCAWLYRSLVEGLFGLSGCREGLRIHCNLPSDWTRTSLTRRFRGSTFNVEITRDPAVSRMMITFNGERLEGDVITGVSSGAVHAVSIVLPANSTMTPRLSVIMGVAGSGKTTLGRLLAEQTGTRFIEADDLHPPENVAAMRRGIPLNDEMREPWMDRILEELTVATLGGMNTVLACSCLRKKHRDRIRACGCAVRFYFLHADRQRLSARLSSRSGHFFPAGLLDSQLTALEDPREDPDGDVMVLDANLPAAELTALISSGL